MFTNMDEDPKQSEDLFNEYRSDIMKLAANHKVNQVRKRSTVISTYDTGSWQSFSDNRCKALRLICRQNRMLYVKGCIAETSTLVKRIKLHLLGGIKVLNFDIFITRFVKKFIMLWKFDGPLHVKTLMTHIVALEDKVLLQMEAIAFYLELDNLYHTFLYVRESRTLYTSLPDLAVDVERMYVLKNAAVLDVVCYAVQQQNLLKDSSTFQRPSLTNSSIQDFSLDILEEQPLMPSAHEVVLEELPAVSEWLQDNGSFPDADILDLAGNLSSYQDLTQYVKRIKNSATTNCRHICSERCSHDVYKFGALLINIVCGSFKASPSGNVLYNEEFFFELRELAASGNLAQAFEPSPPDSVELCQACYYMEIGLQCVQDSIELRPCRSRVVEMLSREVWKYFL